MKLSIIVPVYNAEDTIRRCVDSILGQGFKDFELILVDDGSADRSGSILEDYKEKDNRISVIHQINQGVSAARNVGISNSVGEWISFVDADDYLALNCFETVFDKEEIENYDLVCWNRINVKAGVEQKTYISKEVNEKDKIYSSKELKPYVIWSTNGNIPLGSVCCRLFRKRVMDTYHIRFKEELVYAEDRMFLWDYLEVVQKIFHYSDFLYYRILSADSAMHRWRPDTKDILLLLMQTIEEKIDFTEEKNLTEVYHQFVLVELMSFYLESYLCNAKNSMSRKQRKRELQELLQDERMRNVFKDTQSYFKMSWKSRVKVYCVKYQRIWILDKWYRNKRY